MRTWVRIHSVRVNYNSFFKELVGEDFKITDKITDKKTVSNKYARM